DMGDATFLGGKVRRPAETGWAAITRTDGGTMRSTRTVASGRSLGTNAMNSVEKQAGAWVHPGSAKTLMCANAGALTFSASNIARMSRTRLIDTIHSFGD